MAGRMLIAFLATFLVAGLPLESGQGGSETVTLLRFDDAAGALEVLGSVPPADVARFAARLPPDDLVLTWSERWWLAPARAGDLAVRTSPPPLVGAARIEIAATDDRGATALPPAFALRLRRVDAPSVVALGRNVRGFSERLASSEGGLTLASCLRRPKKTWLCTGPPGVFNLRLQVGDRMETLWREVDLSEPGQTLHVAGRRGLTLSGHIEPAGARLLLLPRLLGEDRGRVDPLRARLVTASDDGSFRFAGIKRGPYRLVVEAAGRARTIHELDLFTDTRLARQRLPTPTSLTIAMAPPRAFDGAPWDIRLVPRDERGSTSGEAVLTTTDAQGWAALPGLAIGDYRLLVSDRSGSRWLSEDISVTDGDEVLHLHVPFVEVVGQARSGDRALAGTLVFGTSFEVVSVRLEIADDGSFGGFLPREGVWSVELLQDRGRCAPCGAETAVQLDVVEVEIGPSGKAFLDLRLPDTTLRGTVMLAVDHALEPAADARVVAFHRHLTEQRPPNEVRVVSDEDGKFAVRGVQPGELMIFATSEDGDAEAPVVAVQVTEGLEGEPVRLIMHPKATFSLLLSSPAGAVAGAAVTARPVLPGDRTTSTVNGFSHADGTVTVEVPGNAHSLDLVVAHPAFAIWIGRVRLATSPSPGISLSPRTEGAHLTLVLPPESAGEFWDRGYLSAGDASFSHRELFYFIREHVAIESGPTLHIADLTPGNYAYCWTTPAVTCRDLALHPGSETRIELLADAASAL